MLSALLLFPEPLLKFLGKEDLSFEFVLMFPSENIWERLFMLTLIILLGCSSFLIYHVYPWLSIGTLKRYNSNKLGRCFGVSIQRRGASFQECEIRMKQIDETDWLANYFLGDLEAVDDVLLPIDCWENNNITNTEFGMKHGMPLFIPMFKVGPRVRNKPKIISANRASSPLCQWDGCLLSIQLRIVHRLFPVTKKNMYFHFDGGKINQLSRKQYKDLQAQQLVKVVDE